MTARKQNPSEIPEIKIRFNRSTRRPFYGKINRSIDVADFIRSIYKRGEIETQEQFIVVYLDQSNTIRGFYRHSVGGINDTIADQRLILAGAIKALCPNIILAHNHPSGNLKPSQADEQLTKKFKEAASLLDLRIIDHIILTKDSYYSFADNGLFGLDNLKLTANEQELVTVVSKLLSSKSRHTRMDVERIAKDLSITNKTDVKELTELAIVNEARRLAHKGGSVEDKYDSIVELYNGQVNLSHRTSQSILLQQYSTPAPIGYLAGVYCGVDQFVGNQRAFEPSAGNGLLTIAGNPRNFTVNEIDYTRNRNLHTQPFEAVKSFNASTPFPKTYWKTFDAVITNPPFGRLEKSIKFDGFPIADLDHAMALYALDCMRDSGKAAIIIGSHTRWDDKGRIQAGKNRIFLNYLHHHYHVSDVIPIDGQKLYSRQGTSFDTRLILIAGRKSVPHGAAPLFDKSVDLPVKSFDQLYNRVINARETLPLMKITIRKNQKDVASLERLAIEVISSLEDDLGAPYIPASESCFKLDTQVPDSMDFEIHEAVKRVKNEVGGDIDNFVRHRLGYQTKKQLCRALSAEQIDAVALAIYNIEARHEGIVIGDQTGIGKGRIAAAMIRYGVVQGYKPIFITEKPNLFSDIYRDLSAIGSSQLRPFIVNGRESKTEIKDEDGETVYQALHPEAQQKVFRELKIPNGYDFVVGTYSQFNSPERKPEKPKFLHEIAAGNLLVLDEAHNASGSSNTGEFLQSVVSRSTGVVFLSATFAKRPDNMPIYAMKTSISEANMSKEELVEAITKGGVALQEILASQLVAEGQMIRRERSFEGVEVNYVSLDQLKEEHQAIADNITQVLRDIIAFQEEFINTQVEELDKIAAASGTEVNVRGGTSKAGVDSLPYFSKVFNVINQMLFSIKAEAVADRAIERLKEGKKPVIAFASTMGSFIEQMENERGLQVSNGDVIRADFSEVLRRGLVGILRYTERDIDGSAIFREFSITELPIEAQITYQRIMDHIKSISTGISISPIDVVVQRIEAAGYTVAEVTGRKYALQLNMKSGQGLVQSRKRINTNDAFRKFNNNEVDVLMINQSGSTGASAHAIVTGKVKEQQVKQRVMIVLQAELDINTEVQKRGRINRTGQILKPIYDYINSAIPAEKRLMMMLQKKLKSLDANTTSNQKQSTTILDVPDFLNKYGDKVVKEYLIENKEVNVLLGDPLQIKDKNSEKERESITEDAAHKVSGRVAVLSVKMQQEFYDEIIERYMDYVEYLKQVGDYDLEVETLNLQAETLQTRTLKMGKGGLSAFGDDSILETVKANVLKKPFGRVELENLLAESLKHRTPQEIQFELLTNFQTFNAQRLEEDREKARKRFEEMMKNLPNERKLVKIKEKQGFDAYEEEYKKRKSAIELAHKDEIVLFTRSNTNRSLYMKRIIDFYSVGKSLNYPMSSFNNGQELVMGVCLGIDIDLRKKNPYAPSAVKVRIAIANSMKYIAIPASYTSDLISIIGVSSHDQQSDTEMLMDNWENAVKERQSDRSTRHIITGNLLQAFADSSGKLVSYTTHEGEVRKGILLSEYWEDSTKSEDYKMIVPIAGAINIIKSLTQGNMLSTQNNLSFSRYGDYIKVYVPASRERGGHFYLDPDLLALTRGNNFEKVSDRMVALIENHDLEAFIQVLQRKHNVSLSVPRSMAHLVVAIERKSTTFPIKLPPLEEAASTVIPLNILELEAEALMIELMLAA